jgi:hypothetical protein
MVDVGDDGDVAQIHVASSKVGQWLERDLAGKPGPTFPDRAQNLELKGVWRPKRKPGQRTGHTLLVAAQYIQKSPKNNGLVAPFWYPPVDLFGNIRPIGWVPRVSECQRSISGDL